MLLVKDTFYFARQKFLAYLEFFSEKTNNAIEIKNIRVYSRYIEV